MAAPQAEKCTLPESFSNINRLHGNIDSVAKPKSFRPYSAPTSRLSPAQSHSVEIIQARSEPNLQENVCKEYEEEDNQESSGYIDLGTIMDSLERLDTEEEHQPVPEELLCLIRRLCRKCQVNSAVWAQSSTDWREIIILGGGVTKIQHQLVKEAKTLHPEFKFVTSESGPLHTYQFRELFVIQRRADQQPQRWIDAARASCQLFLSAEDKHSCRPGERKKCLIAPAHLILNGTQCDAIVQSSDPTLIEQIREDVESQTSKTGYILEVSNQGQTERINLEPQVMFAYRQYYRNISTTTADPSYRCVGEKCRANQQPSCPHMYMNDIAIFSISSAEIRKLRTEICGDTRFHFDQIASVKANTVEKLIKLKTKFYVNNSLCQLIAGFKSVDDTAERTYADHVTFKFMANEGVPLGEGSSGSILYIKHQGIQVAFAMVTGKIAEMTESRYQAILLEPALKEIEMDYSHHVADFKPFNFRNRCGAIPPTADTFTL